MASRKPHLEAHEVEELDLFDALADHVEEEADALLAAVVGPGRDSKRRFRGKVRVDVWTRDKGRCFYCAAFVTPSKTQVDHVVPWSRGGRTVLLNGVVSCAPCNRTKSNKVW